MNRLRELRESNNLTQRECAEIANISKKTYERYEKGVREIPSKVLVKFYYYYNVSVDYILCITADERQY